MFDTKNLESLQNTEKWLMEAKSVNSDEPLIFLVGTKRELLVSLLIYLKLYNQANVRFKIF